MIDWYVNENGCISKNEYCKHNRFTKFGEALCIREKCIESCKKVRCPIVYDKDSAEEVLNGEIRVEIENLEYEMEQLDKRRNEIHEFFDMPFEERKVEFAKYKEE